MSATMIPHLFYHYQKDSFEIKIISFYDVFISSLCLVFYKGKHLTFNNAIIRDALFVDKDKIELELLYSNGEIFFFYYYPETGKSEKISKEKSDILTIRKNYKEKTFEEDFSDESQIPFFLLEEY